MPYYSQFLTATEIISASRAECLGSTKTSITAISDPMLKDYIDWLQKDFALSSFTDFDVQGWSHLIAKAEYRTSTSTSLAENVTSESLTIPVTADVQEGALLLSDGFIPPLTVGALMLQDPDGGFDIVEFTEYSQGAFTIDTTGQQISLPHFTGESVEFLYTLPADFGKIKHIYADDSTELQPYHGPGLPTGYAYKILDKYLLFPRKFGNHTVSLEYHKVPATVDDDNDVTAFPTQLRRYAVEMVNGFIYDKRRKFNYAKQARDNAYEQLQRFAAYDSNQDSNDMIYV